MVDLERFESVRPQGFGYFPMTGGAEIIHI
jgi:hypothetical protein